MLHSASPFRARCVLRRRRLLGSLVMVTGLGLFLLVSSSNIVRRLLAGRPFDWFFFLAHSPPYLRVSYSYCVNLR